MRISHLLCNIVIDDNVSDLVEQLSERGDGGAGSGDVLNASAPQESVQLPVGQSRIAWTLQHEAWRRMSALDTQKKSDKKLRDRKWCKKYEEWQTADIIQHQKLTYNRKKVLRSQEVVFQAFQ